MTDKIIKVLCEGYHYFTKESDFIAGRTVYHNDNDQPAIIFATGEKHWYVNGHHHRDNDRPAIVHPGGAKYWYRNGKCHRDNDQPAIIHANGTKYWFVNGLLTDTPEEKDRKAREAWADKYL